MLGGLGGEKVAVLCARNRGGDGDLHHVVCCVSGRLLQFIYEYMQQCVMGALILITAI